MRVALSLLVFCGILCLKPASAQEEADSSRGPTGFEFTGVPALSYDADEGFGYGVLLELYHYGEGEVKPYWFTIQPKIVRSTGGRRDYVLFFDAPQLPTGRWRTTAHAGYEHQITSPYYGYGNRAAYRPSAAEGENPYFYRFGLRRRHVSVNMQRTIADLPLRMLGGVRGSYATVTPVPKDEGTTLLARHLEQHGGTTKGWSNSLRVGLVWDTRNRETGPHRGSWSELLIRRVDEILGSVAGYTRWTLTDRRYIPLASDITFANRLLLQQAYGEAPFYDLYVVESSYKRQYGLGGAETIRGLLKDRYLGKGLFVWNAELRWRVMNFQLFDHSFHTVLSGFVDSGRVWENRLDPGELFSNLHHGVGGGFRIGMGENFVVALDIGYGTEAGMRIYTGTGYLF